MRGAFEVLSCSCLYLFHRDLTFSNTILRDVAYAFVMRLWFDGLGKDEVTKISSGADFSTRFRKLLLKFVFSLPPHYVEGSTAE